MSELVSHKCAPASVTETVFPKNHGAVRLGEEVSLRLGRVHEVMGGAGDVFAALGAARAAGPVVWIGRRRNVGSLAPGGLQPFLDPGRVVLVEVASRQEGLWAAEQAMRLGGAGCVIAELGNGPNLTESRRLQIAAEQSGCLGFVLIGTCAQSSAAQTRWTCEAVHEAGADWVWRLMKNKAGETGAWRVRFTGAEYGADIVHLAASTAA